MATFAIFVFVSLSLFDFANAFDKEDDIESISQSLHNTKLATPPTPRPITAEMMPEPRPSTAETMRENKTIVEERVLANMDPSPVSNNNNSLIVPSLGNNNSFGQQTTALLISNSSFGQSALLNSNNSLGESNSNRWEG